MRFLDRLLPVSHRKAAPLRARARVAVAMVMLATVACAVFVAVNIREGNATFTVIYGVATSVSLLSLPAFRAFDSLRAPIHLLAAIITVVLVATCVAYGKADVGTLIYFAVLPLALLFIDGARAGVLWLITGTVVSAAVCVADAHGFLPPATAHNNIVSDFSNVFVLSGLVFGFAFLFYALKRDAVRAAEDASRAKGDFIATMTHELRTPLSGVIGMADVLADTSAGDDSPAATAQRDIARTIRRSGEALLEVIDDILNFEKLEAGALLIHDEETDPRILATFVHDLLALRAAEKDLLFEVTVAAAVPARVLADQGALRQVLLNLVGNAIKFTGSGSVAVAVSAPAGRLRFEVTDTGIGVSPDVRPRLFSPFSQGDSSTARRYGGTGLGLSICKRLVSAMAGTIDFVSEPGRGSTFFFDVPLRVAPTSAPPRPVVAGARAAGRRALIVEDNPVNQQVTMHLLRARSISCDLAGDGDAALTAISVGSFDIVFMDVQLPGIDGFEVTRRVRASEKSGWRVPIVAMTASAQPSDRDACVAAGMDDYLTKPVTHEELDRVIARFSGADAVSPAGLRRDSGPTAATAKPER